MTNEEAVRKLEYSKTAYQMLIDEKVDSGKLVGKDVKGEWKADTPLDEAYKSMIEALEMGIKAIKALEQEPCEDCISRQAVLDMVEDITDQFGNKHRVVTEGMISLLPPVTPQPKIGHWIKDDITERSKSAYKHKCDRCGAYHRAMYDYCPSCGARMLEPQERSDKE